MRLKRFWEHWYIPWRERYPFSRKTWNFEKATKAERLTVRRTILGIPNFSVKPSVKYQRASTITQAAVGSWDKSFFKQSPKGATHLELRSWRSSMTSGFEASDSDKPSGMDTKVKWGKLEAFGALNSVWITVMEKPLLQRMLASWKFGFKWPCKGKVKRKITGFVSLITIFCCCVSLCVVLLHTGLTIIEKCSSTGD